MNSKWLVNYRQVSGSYYIHSSSSASKIVLPYAFKQLSPRPNSLGLSYFKEINVQIAFNYDAIWFLQDRPLFETMDRVSNVKNLQNNLLTEVTCQTNSHLNTTAVTINSFVKLIKIYAKCEITSCNSQ